MKAVLDGALPGSIVPNSMPEVLVATPLGHVAVKPCVLSDGISIRELSPILWDASIFKGYMSEEERKGMAKTRYWLCASKEVEYVGGIDGDDLYVKASYAALALQIICPSGAKHVFVRFHRTDGGYDIIGQMRPKELGSTLLGPVVLVEPQELQHRFDAVYTGIQRSFSRGIVRLQNPIALLEHGMQVQHVPLGALMFVMGLDVLFMAGEAGTFMRRVGGFLGLDSYVFPPVTTVNLQPNVVVRDVLQDLYNFRNVIAHGQEIPNKYREECDLVSVDGLCLNYDAYNRAQLMEESGLFMLTTALRRVFTEEGLLDEIKDTTKWRLKMAVYEHRYKAGGGPVAVKTLGR